ncbi:MAG: hypothetical protein AB7O95_10265 [Geminicoccaceae bacterium]
MPAINGAGIDWRSGGDRTRCLGTGWRRTMIGKSGRAGLAALFAFGAAMLGGGAARADACDSKPTASHPLYERIPDCELQVQAPVDYGTLHTSGWAYYCTGDHPYFWGYDYSFSPSFTFDNTCFSVAENVFFEDPSKFDATITNWCDKPETIIVTLACSSRKQPHL